MALIILEGLDRTGKSSVAQMLEGQGYELVHMSAPPKGYSSDQYIGEMVDMLTSFSGRDVVLDRSHYGELIWPKIYGRDPLLTDDDMEMLREIEDQLGVTRVLMHDPDSKAHWQRCVDNKEPLTQTQFVKARALYSAMADKYGFDRKTLKDFPDAEQPLPANIKAQSKSTSISTDTSAEASSPAKEAGDSKSNTLSKSKEQLKLERANIINEQPQSSRKERLQELDVRLKNLEMASRISQMMTQQLMQNLKPMHEDLTRVTGLIQELQYKVLAAQKVSGLSVEALNDAANAMRLSDFNEASDKEDAQQGFTIGTTVNEQSTVILTTTTEEKDRGIFRSRLKLSECGVPDLIAAFMGREVGAKALVQLNGLEHEVELLGIRQPAAPAVDQTNSAGTQSTETPATTQEVASNA
ncbi:unnamed protein product [Sphagnum balticum]